MNTGFRRFILRLAVGLLAFFIGIGVSWAIGGLNPFQSSGTRSYKKRCGYSHRSWSAAPSEMHNHGTVTDFEATRSSRMKRVLVDIPPPPPPPPAPAAPVTLGGS